MWRMKCKYVHTTMFLENVKKDVLIEPEDALMPGPATGEENNESVSRDVTDMPEEGDVDVDGDQPA